jgi:hypothetical protein
LVCTEEKQIPRCARDGILRALSFRAKRSGARSDFRTPVESIGLQKPENLLLVAPLGRAVLCVLRLELERRIEATEGPFVTALGRADSV